MEKSNHINMDKASLKKTQQIATHQIASKE